MQPTNTLPEVEKAIQADLSIDAAHEHMAFLVEQVGERLAGTDSIQKAANYIRQELERCGLEARIDRFPIYQSYPKSAALRVTYPEERVIEALPSCHILSTTDEGITGELVYAGAGGYEDYENIDAKDKIILTDMTWAPPRPEKARIAVEKQAKALIILNWGPPSLDPVIQRGAIKSVWGNPTPTSFKQIPQIPVINITRASGEYLKALCSKGAPVTVWLRAEATREWVSANQPVGVLRTPTTNFGRNELVGASANQPVSDAHTLGSAGEFVLVGGHLEGWGKTAICNSSGNALMLALARAFARHRDKLKRDIVFAFWDGHEIAEAAGSTYFVDAHWDELSRGCIAYVDIDNPAILGTSVPNSRSAPEVKRFLLDVITEVWGRQGNWRLPYKGGDQSFFGVGVPYISFATGYTPEELEKLNGASLSPWLHSEADTLDKIDPELYARHLSFFATLILRLCNAEMIPYDLAEPVALLQSHLEALEKLSEGVPSVELDGLIGKAEQLAQSVQELERHKAAVSGLGREKEEATRLVNAAAIKVTRELSTLWTEASKYDQDPYGYHLIGKPIPRLYVPIVQMKQLRADDPQFNLWQTQLTRGKNRVSDILGRAIEHLELTTRLFEKLA